MTKMGRCEESEAIALSACSPFEEPEGNGAAIIGGLSTLNSLFSFVVGTLKTGFVCSGACRRDFEGPAKLEALELGAPFSVKGALDLVSKPENRGISVIGLILGLAIGGETMNPSGRPLGMGRMRLAGRLESCNRYRMR